MQWFIGPYAPAVADTRMQTGGVGGQSERIILNRQEQSLCVNKLSVVTYQLQTPIGLLD
jgi:hypothetical protein